MDRTISSFLTVFQIVLQVASWPNVRNCLSDARLHVQGFREMKEMPVLRGDGVVLRAFASADVTLLEEVAADPLIPKISTVPAVYSETSALEYIERQHHRFRSGQGYSFVICSDEHACAVGYLGVWIADLAKGRATVGYWVAKSARGSGLCGWALQLVSSWAFEALPVHRLTAYVEPWNVASIRTAESAGFASEALLRSWELVGDEPKDMLSMSRLRD
jgi:[ribosomal protein S5]-alanine N-acetyltransferase